jgi:hypothetical protein
VPTLTEIGTWPATVGVKVAGSAFGFSRSYAYELAHNGEFPVKVIKIRGRYKVVTASIIDVLSGQNGPQRT